MKARHLAIQLSLAASVLVGANKVVERLSANSVPRQLLRTAEQSQPATHLFLGNSTMATGCDQTAFANTRPGSSPLNLGLGASGPVEHYLIYRQQSKHLGAAVYYGFFDTQLTDPASGDWTTLIGTRAMAYYVEPEVARRFYTTGFPVRDLLFRIFARVPILSERYAIWAKVERLRRGFGEIGMPAKAKSQFGQVEDFSQMEISGSDFVARCEQAVAERTPLSKPIAAIFEDARGAGRRLLVVEMPMPRNHRERFYGLPAWTAYREHIKQLIAYHGGIYIEASDWIGDEGFVDPVHLNTLGAAGFSSRLGRDFP